MQSINLTIIALITAPIGITFAFLSIMHDLAKSRQQKDISYSIIYDMAFTKGKGLEDYIEISSQEDPITDARFVIIKIQNIGNMAVHSKDYYVPITFEFGDRVISSHVEGITPAGRSNLKADIAPPTRPDEQSVALDQIHLKPKEGIIMSVIVAGPPKRHIKVKGRIVDGRVGEQSSFALTT
jgi:hypothetical protein